jgi:PPOX class probable F420-dependent enzyme
MGPVWPPRSGSSRKAGGCWAQTGPNSGKIKRIRRNPRVMIAPCGATGRLRAEPVPALAELLPAADLGRVQQLMARKYRIDLVLIKPIRSLQAALHRGQPPDEEVAVAITPVRV